MAGRQHASGATPAAPGQSPALVGLVYRLILVQAALTAVLGLAFPAGGTGWLLFALALAAGLCCLAGLTRSGTHAAWIAALGCEAMCIAAGLLRLMTARYLGGTLFAIITLGVLLHPAVGRAFGGQSAHGQPARGRPGETIADQGLTQNAGRSS